jgi:nitrite reductase/ring-hydroxylating ferredoxin subunit
MPAQPYDRRAVLAGAGSVCALALLGACTSGGKPNRSPAAGTTPASTPPPASATPTGSPVPAGFLARLDEVPVGGGLLVKGDVLLVRPSAGTVKAYDARCPHQGVILPPPDADGVITCPNHRARYRAGDGSLIDGPAPSGLNPVPVRVADGQVLRA